MIICGLLLFMPLARSSERVTEYFYFYPKFSPKVKTPKESAQVCRQAFDTTLAILRAASLKKVDNYKGMHEVWPQNAEGWKILGNCGLWHLERKGEEKPKRWHLGARPWGQEKTCLYHQVTEAGSKFTFSPACGQALNGHIPQFSQGFVPGMVREEVPEERDFRLPEPGEAIVKRPKKILPGGNCKRGELCVVADELSPEPSKDADFAYHEEEIFKEMNRIRKDPAGWARKVLPPIWKTRGIPSKVREAAKEALDEMTALSPLPLLERDGRMDRAARSLVTLHGAAGKMGHIGTDGSTPSDRISKQGEWKDAVGENIHYGENDPKDKVLDLIMDVGVPDRGHRKNILSPDYFIVGVACGGHATYGMMCVQDFAGGME